jgi:hypothetical protein
MGRGADRKTYIQPSYQNFIQQINAGWKKSTNKKETKHMEANTAAPRTPTVLSLLGALLILLIGGGLLGIVIGLVGSFFYLAILFPIGMGFGASLVAGPAARTARVRRNEQVLLVFVLAGLVVYGSFHYGRYIMFQLGTWLELSSTEAVQTSGTEIDFKVAKVIADYALKKETGHTGFLGYMLYRAKTGISIGRFYSENRLQLTGLLAWLYWAAELGLVLYIARGGVKDFGKAPYCEACGKRLGHERHLGGTVPANEPLLLDMLGRHDLAGLGELLVRDAGLPSVELYLRKCDACGGSTSFLTVRRASLGRGGVVLSDISKASLAPQEGTQFLQQLSFEVE